MDILSSIIILILTLTPLYFSIKISFNLLKYGEAALGLIFTHLNQSIVAFKVYAIAALLIATGRLLDVFNAMIPSFYVIIDNVTTLLYLITTALLIYAFYKLSVIVRMSEKKLESR